MLLMVGLQISTYNRKLRLRFHRFHIILQNIGLGLMQLVTYVWFHKVLVEQLGN